MSFFGCASVPKYQASGPLNYQVTFKASKHLLVGHILTVSVHDLKPNCETVFKGNIDIPGNTSQSFSLAPEKKFVLVYTIRKSSILERSDSYTFTHDAVVDISRNSSTSYLDEVEFDNGDIGFSHFQIKSSKTAIKRISYIENCPNS